MSLRTRLFCTYTGLVLAALLLFGALTQRQASAMADQREVELLRSHAGYLARQFAQLLQEGIPASVALANLREYSDRDWILQVQSVGSITLSRKPDGITLPLDLPQLTDPYTRSGHSVQGGRSYAWATVESPGTAYHLRLLRASTREDPMLAKGLLTRLAFAGGLVLLLISGAALLLSQRIARGFRAETAALTHRALHDSLTGLPNRTLLFDRLAHTLGEAHRHGNPVGLFILDLDRFKEVNDTLGH
ncbi:MAG: diguanylate cyclase domain-containing protein, partial [Gammaproteobacteria bacterium]